MPLIEELPAPPPPQPQHAVLKEQGTAKLKAKDFGGAFDAYTAAIQSTAPAPAGRELAVLLSNRSLVRLKLREAAAAGGTSSPARAEQASAELALRDAEESAAADRTYHKAKFRQAKALQALGGRGKDAALLLALADKMEAKAKAEARVCKAAGQGGGKAGGGGCRGRGRGGSGGSGFLGGLKRGLGGGGLYGDKAGPKPPPPPPVLPPVPLFGLACRSSRALRWAGLGGAEHGLHGCGLVNLGNTCFINSVLQCLVYTAPLSGYLLRLKPSRTSLAAAPFCMLCELEQHLHRVLRSSAAAGGGAANANANAISPSKVATGAAAIRPLSIARHLSSLSSEFKYGMQEDAHEFCVFVLQAMVKSCFYGYGGGTHDYGLVTEELERATLVHHIFGSTLRSWVTCGGCGAVSETRHNQLELDLMLLDRPGPGGGGGARGLDPLSQLRGGLGFAASASNARRGQQSVSVPSLLADFIRPEALESYHCEQCGAKEGNVASKANALAAPPNVLVLMLKRCGFGNFSKSNVHVELEPTLDFGPFTSPPSRAPVPYDLYAVLVHVDVAHSTFFGHYIAFVKDSAGRWFLLDDATMRRVTWAHVARHNAYILFYQRPAAALRLAFPRVAPGSLPGVAEAHLAPHAEKSRGVLAEAVAAGEEEEGQQQQQQQQQQEEEEGTVTATPHIVATAAAAVPKPPIPMTIQPRSNPAATAAAAPAATVPAAAAAAAAAAAEVTTAGAEGDDEDWKALD